MALSRDKYLPPHVVVKGNGDGGEAVSMNEDDLQALAEEVLALLKRELRLERERQGRHQA